MNAATLLLQHASQFADKPAIIAPDRVYTYFELKEASLAVASYLVRSGASKGDRVLLQAENSFYWSASYIGILRSGCVCVPVAPSMTSSELAQVLSCTEPAFVFVDKPSPELRKYEPGRMIVKTSDCPEALAFGEFLHQQDESALPAIDDRSDLAALMFTSGSTSVPRGVMVSHRNIIANTTSILDYMRLSPDDRVMATLPFYYCFGTSLLHTHLAAGASLVTGVSLAFADALLHKMNETHCTGFAGVPSHYQILLRKSSLKQIGLPHLRWAQQAGGRLPLSFIKEWRSTVPHARFYVMYGQTEATARLAYLPPEWLDRKPESMGKPISGVQLQVVDDRGEPVPPGEVGEIMAWGDNVTLGYWQAPAETQSVFRNGGLRTGDYGKMDSDGFFYVVDRKKDMVKCGGVRVGSSRIEDALLSSGSVLEAAVIGVPHELLGEAPVAFVVAPAADASLLEHLRNCCRQILPLQLVPQQILLMEALPKNDAGKIRKEELRAYWNRTHPTNTPVSLPASSGQSTSASAGLK